MIYLDSDGITEITEKTFTTPLSEDEEYLFYLKNDGSSTIDNVTLSFNPEASCATYNAGASGTLDLEITNSAYLKGVGWIELNYENKTGRVKVKDIKNGPRQLFYSTLPSTGLSEWQTHIISGLKMKLRRHDEIEDSIINTGIWLCDCYRVVSLAKYNEGSTSDYVQGNINFGSIDPGDVIGFKIKIPALTPLIDSVFNPQRFKVTAKERTGDEESLRIEFSARNKRTANAQAFIIEDDGFMPWSSLFDATPII